jgi:hypothetical protein
MMGYILNGWPKPSDVWSMTFSAIKPKSESSISLLDLVMRAKKEIVEKYSIRE